MAWMPKCELPIALTTLRPTQPKVGDRPLSTMRPLLSKFGELLPLTSSMLRKSRDRPASIQGSHIVTYRGHLSPLMPARRSLPKPRVHLPSTPMLVVLLMLVVTCLTMTTSNAGKFYATVLRGFFCYDKAYL